MADAWIIGSYSTSFGRFADRSVKDLTREAVLGALQDASMSDAQRVEATWFGNCGMWVDAQGGIRGQVCLTPLVRAGIYSARTPVINVEAGCATASLALHGAWLAIRAGQYDVTLALGVEKTFYPGRPNARRRCTKAASTSTTATNGWTITARQAKPPASRSRRAPTARSSWIPTPCRRAGT